MRRIILLAAILSATAGIGTASAAPHKAAHHCRAGFHMVHRSRFERRHGKRVRVTFATCVRSRVQHSHRKAVRAVPTATATATMTMFVVSVEANAPDPSVVIASATTTPQPTGGTYSVSIIDTTTGSTLGTWTTSGSTNAISSGVLGIQWDYNLNLSGPTTLTFDTTPLRGVAWTGPASVSLSQADVAGLDIVAQASFSGSAGFAASKSSVETIAI